MTDNRATRRASRRSTRKKVRVTSVIGEILIVSGLAVFGYIVWQPWHTGVTVQQEQQVLSADLSSSWSTATKNLDADDQVSHFDGPLPIVGEKAADESFAVLHVPAFGKTYANVIAEGVSDAGVLNPSDKGIGRYTTTQQFGEVGNVGLAAHRSGAFITPFRDITNLRVGDPLFIETEEGWYTYRYRSTEYVWPEESEVLAEFPRMMGVQTEDRILTLTSCHPKEWSTEERVIAYSVFESFSPRSEGVPEELAKSNPRLGQERANS